MKFYQGGFGTGMGQYGDKEYPEFYPDDRVIITLPYYSRKATKKTIIIGEGIIMDAPVYSGKKPYLVKIVKYATEGYDKYPNVYDGIDIETDSRLLLSRDNIQTV